MLTFQTYLICVEELACFRKRFHVVKRAPRHAIGQLARTPNWGKNDKK